MTAARASAPLERWTQPEDLIEVLRRRWARGDYLRLYAAGEPWTPVSLPVRGPDASELLEHLDHCRQWLTRFQRQASGFDVEYKVVRSRHLGANRIPARVVVHSLDQLAHVLGTAADLTIFDELVDHTHTVMPELVPWVRANPMVALRNVPIWAQALAAVSWVSTHDTAKFYLRQIDAEGVDTKFVECHHRLLADMLGEILPPQRIGTAGGFAGKFGFRSKPSYTRLRFLDPALELVPGLSELSLRTDELADVAPGPSTVFIVENEVTYLAFPLVPSSIVVFGSGFALAGLARVGAHPWLSEREIVYWGDIDTHGFDILSRLRGVFPSVRSILMDRNTLLGHRLQWVSEDSPTTRTPPNLTPDEASLYRDLVEGVYGEGVRLEQERVRFSFLEDALRSLQVMLGSRCSAAFPPTSSPIECAWSPTPSGACTAACPAVVSVAESALVSARPIRGPSVRPVEVVEDPVAVAEG